MEAEIRDKLRNLYTKNIVAGAFFDWILTREKGSHVTKARVAADRTLQSYADILELFREFDKLQIGSFIVGRRGAETRFDWLYDVKGLAQIAKGESDEVEPISARSAGANNDDEEANSTIDHSFNLRADFTVVIKLPMNFSEREAERLAAWVRTLPFDEQ